MKLTELFDRGKFVVTSEVSPPKGICVDEMLHEATDYMQGLDGVNVTDNPSSVMRMSTLAACGALLNKGVTPIYQLTCRDRNRLALQSDLLGAAMMGIENLLLLTGDHTIRGDHPQARSVFDLDSVSLIHAVRQLESGMDLAGNPLTSVSPSFAKGAALSPCSDSAAAQLSKMERKIMAGADYFQTQAVFDSEKFISFMEKAKAFNKPVQLGIVILQSAEMAQFMNDFLAGVSIPQDMINELARDPQRAASGETGLEIAARIIKECRPYCQGVHIMAAGWEHLVPDLLKLAELK